MALHEQRLEKHAPKVQSYGKRLSQTWKEFVMYIKYYTKKGGFVWFKHESGNLYRKFDRNGDDTGFLVSLALAVSCGSYREP